MNNFLKLRKEKGLTQEELGKAMSVSQASVSQWDRGTSWPEAETLVKLADLFGVSTDYLLNRTENRNFYKNNTPMVEVSKEVRELVMAYRKADSGIKRSVRKLLDIQQSPVHNQNDEEANKTSRNRASTAT